MSDLLAYCTELYWTTRCLIGRELDEGGTKATFINSIGQYRREQRFYQERIYKSHPVPYVGIGQSVERPAYRRMSYLESVVNVIYICY